jgi:6-phosphofructokinase 1
MAAEDRSGSVAIQYADRRTRLALVGLDKVAGKTRVIPMEVLDPATSHVSDAGMAYLGRLLPERPDILTLPL